MLMSVSVEYENDCKEVLDLDKPLKNFVRQKEWLIVRYKLINNWG